MQKAKETDRCVPSHVHYQQFIISCDSDLLTRRAIYSFMSDIISYLIGISRHCTNSLESVWSRSVAQSHHCVVVEQLYGTLIQTHVPITVSSTRTLKVCITLNLGVYFFSALFLRVC